MRHEQHDIPSRAFELGAPNIFPSAFPTGSATTTIVAAIANLTSTDSTQHTPDPISKRKELP
jgi:hypothetical protein